MTEVMEMDMERIPAQEGNYNLQNYETMRKSFSWDEMKPSFSWNETGKVNMAYEAIDRHAENPDRKNKVALYYSAPDREEQMTFREISEQSSQFANVLRKHNIEK